MVTKTRRILPSEAAAALGSISTPKKAASSAANGIKTRFKAKPLAAFTCTCGKCPDNPKTYCPRGRAIIRRRDKLSVPTDAAARLLALPSCNTREGLPELDLSGERGDVYGYTEREDAQL